MEGDEGAVKLGDEVEGGGDSTASESSRGASLTNESVSCSSERGGREGRNTDSSSRSRISDRVGSTWSS